jgi:hypothetical protein
LEGRQLAKAGLFSRKAGPAMANVPETQAALIAMAAANQDA